MATDSNVCQSIHSPQDRMDDNTITEPTSADFMDSDSMKSKMKLHEFVVDMMSRLKLNPLAEEFIPVSDLHNHHQFAADASQNNQRRRNYRWMNSRTSRAQIENSIRRTIYITELDHYVTEQHLADFFNQICGQVVDCRVCGDPHSRFRFAFVEFGHEQSARYAMVLSRDLLVFYSMRVLPSKTAIQPVNPIFLPRTEYEREMCARTVYCTNIDKMVSQSEVKNFFESHCGEVSHLRLFGNNAQSARSGFIEFEMAESAIEALKCSGKILGTQYLRVSPSKTPVRPKMSRAGVYY
ncbi:polyadenylate-binding protein-interacting protein 9-like [Impatiens glandulifera]|uniref:polyadenylate-binding protein-interacting protein 9-like n=1 Tax=Impatiens glandulifera TaxID=253017 RepID=UPI001FB0510B|nr:polyadenylate-binding protein-interacting protein 9-like [Impatiens glandulifera]